MVAARRLYRFHQADGGQVRDRHHARGRIGRANSHRRLSQRRTDLGAERTRDHVLTRPRWERRADALHSGCDGPQRANVEDAELRVRSCLVAAIAVRPYCIPGAEMELVGVEKAPHSPGINHRRGFSALFSKLSDPGNTRSSSTRTYA